MVACTICGSSRFVAGPNGRLTATGLPPRCVTCGALERHRIARGMLEIVKLDDRFRSYRTLQFSKDPIVPSNWFKSDEVSIFGGQNSMDVQDIPRKAGSYDIIICCHVIEHVPNHRKAVRSLARVLNGEGLLFLAYPNPIRTARTRDWGYADGAQHGHYRVFGRDFETEYRSIIPGITVIAATGRDRVTGATDLHYLITKSRFWEARIRAMLPEARVVQ
jgi:SAM-dependent methyltransferase